MLTAFKWWIVQFVYSKIDNVSLLDDQYCIIQSSWCYKTFFYNLIQFWHFLFILLYFERLFRIVSNRQSLWILQEKLVMKKYFQDWKSILNTSLNGFLNKLTKAFISSMSISKSTRVYTPKWEPATGSDHFHIETIFITKGDEYPHLVALKQRQANS